MFPYRILKSRDGLMRIWVLMVSLLVYHHVFPLSILNCMPMLLSYGLMMMTCLDKPLWLMSIVCFFKNLVCIDLHPWHLY